jgi:hypothetical protein
VARAGGRVVAVVCAVIACCDAVRVLWWRVIWCVDRLLCVCWLVCALVMLHRIDLMAI